MVQSMCFNRVVSVKVVRAIKPPGGLTPHKVHRYMAAVQTEPAGPWVNERDYNYTLFLL